MLDIAITGVGVVSSIGNGLGEFSQALYRGTTKISRPPWPARPEFEGVWVSNIEGFRPTDWMADKVAEGTDRFGQYLIAAAVQAIQGADLKTPPDPYRTAVITGTALGAVDTISSSQHGLDSKGPAGISSKFHIRAWPNMGSAQIALRYGLHGPLMTVATACASSLDAIGLAARLITSGQADTAIAGGADASMTELRVLSGARYGMFKPVSDPAHACRPFDKNRTGVVLGEGAGVVFLERRDAADQRGATIYGIIRGYASLSDAHHVSSPGPEGLWQAQTIHQAVSEAGLKNGARSIDAVMAHATGTPVGDMAEIRAINLAFGEHAKNLRAASIKGHVGHPAGAAGAMTLIAGLASMQIAKLIPTAGAKNIDPEAQFRVPTLESGDASGRGKIGAMVVNAFGFGGQNASVVVAAPQ